MTKYNKRRLDIPFIEWLYKYCQMYCFSLKEYTIIYYRTYRTTKVQGQSKQAVVILSSDNK